MNLVIDKEKLKQLRTEKQTAKKYTILVVDDELINLEALTMILEEQYHVIKANSGLEALELIRHDPNPARINLIISDQRMPGMMGVEFLQQTIPIIPKTIRILLTGYTDVNDIIDSINEGQIYKFLTKPIGPMDLMMTIKRALEAYDLEIQKISLITQLQEWNDNLEKTVAARTDDLIRANAALHQEIAERQLAEQTIRQQHAFLTTVIDSLPHPFYVINAADYTIKIANRFASATGVTPGVTCYASTHHRETPCDSDTDPCPLNTVRQTKTPTVVEHQHVDAAGNPIYVEVHGYPMLNAQGELEQMIEYALDITARKYAEAALREAHHELQEKNAQLQDLNASKDKFFSIIAHDLRSPFNALLGYIELMGSRFDELSPTELKKYVEKLRRSAERLFALLENLLTWSRIQRGMMEYTPEALDLREILDNNVELFTSNAERKQVGLNHTLLEKQLIYADFNMVTTVIRNLISNALKFTPSGGRILLSTQEQANSVEVTVNDTGVGMNAETLAKLFRIDANYTTVGTSGEQGTGLGLILCQDLVRKNGGNIGVESAIGAGTTFRFTIPKHPAAHAKS